MRGNAEAGRTVSHPLAGSELEFSIAEMRALLARTRPTSDAEALRALRHAFPAATLEQRVAAMSGRAR